MISFAEAYAPAHILAAVREAEPIGEVARHRMPSSQWRRYDKMKRFPDGLLVVGDAICSFNPVYGQGMTVSALDAVALRDCLRRGDHNLPRRYFRAAAKQISVAWQMAAGADLAFPEVEGRRSPATLLMNRFADWALTACESDPITVTRFFRVNSLVDPPLRLLHPSFVVRAAKVNLRRRKRTESVTEASATSR
jgi:2-polyprenyl-6-methoxyphenol hydroxylase-like FAD-dependent oxidoreductase